MEIFSCQKETHGFNKILGICFNSKCPDSVPQFCFKCIIESHKECQTDCHQFGQMNQFFQQIVENFEEQEIQLESEFEIVRKKYEATKKELLMKKGQFIQFQESDRNSDFHIIKARISMIKQEYNKLKSENYIFNVTKDISNFQLKIKNGRKLQMHFMQGFKTNNMNQLYFSKVWLQHRLTNFQNLKNIQRDQNFQHRVYLIICKIFVINKCKKWLEDWIQSIIQGIILVYKKEFQKAIEYFDKCLQLDPQNMYCLYLKCVALLNLKKYSQSIQIIGLMKQINSNYYLLYIIEGYVLFSQRKDQQAIECYDKAKFIQEQYSSAHLYGGECLLSLGRNKEAQQYLERAIALGINTTRAFNLLGNSLFQMQKFKESIQYYDKAIQLNNDFLFAHLYKGLALTELSKFQEAVQTFDKILQLNPKFSIAYYGKGIILMKQLKYKEALICFDEALKINYIDFDSLHNKGICLYNLKEYGKAAECFQTAVQLNPTKKESHYSLGICLKRQKKFTQAIVSFENLLKIDKQFLKVHFQKGCCYFQLGKYKEGIKCFEQAIQQDQQDYIAYLYLGNCLKKLNKLNDAMIYYDQVIFMDPTIYLSYINKGNLLRKQLNYQEAINQYHQAIHYYNQEFRGNLKQEKFDGSMQNIINELLNLIRLFQQNHTEQDDLGRNYLMLTYYKLGQCLFSLKQYDQAENSFKQAFSIDCSNLDALNFQGLSLCLLNKIQQGLDCFKESFKLNTKNPLALFLKEFYENIPSFNGEKIKNLIQSLLPQQNQSEELEVQYFIFCEVIDNVKTINDDSLEQIVHILKKMKKLLK